MRLKATLRFLVAIIAHTANLYEALAVNTGDLGAIVVELAVIDVVLVLRVQFKRTRTVFSLSRSTRCDLLLA